MAQAVIGRVAGRGAQPSFHLWMALLMAGFVLTGFGISYIAPLLAGTFKPASTVSLDTPYIAAQAVARIAERIDDPDREAVEVVAPHRLIVRESSAVAAPAPPA